MKKGRIESAIVCVFGRCDGNRDVFVWLGFVRVCKERKRVAARMKGCILWVWRLGVEG